MLKNLIKLILLVFWPLTFFLANNTTDFLTYFSISALIFLTFFLFNKKYSFYLLPLIAIPFIDPKLSAFPILASAVAWFLEAREPRKLILNWTTAALFLSILAVGIQWKEFKNQTVFFSDYEAQQKVLRNITLYPNVFSARLFQNKVRIVFDKFSQNFFALTDPNNYFFSYHPREGVVSSQNLVKYPFLGIVYFLFGLFSIKTLKSRKFIVWIVVALMVSLSVLKIFDRSDFTLWIPLSLVTVYGVDVFYKARPRLFRLFSFFFIFFSAIELIRILVVL
ncbi:hypothetical protein A3E46_02745 [Candidatus Woesebacteria bacterium RIFCSPHIGHO2_12_FULL_46_16]|uniref:Glycosyltransferase RgtA/B/C/D-like domain-containing protein n=1 Tax=Candidatus Woesebacteria bacterium RIFCSPHIGHO2_12_FULL_46_16 TaxID=1802513 RepID=A0A1F8B011_9BACT|nr:MAG: hypothetical protein A3E46_02745 [Candidatus Woesebacteria bacterium RIFCSPHIGHO2_12_FULL_46_16]